MSETTSGDGSGSLRVVTADESEIHDEPHVAGSRVTVRGIHARVEEGDTRPAEVADQLELGLAEVYEALAYYHRNPEQMRRIERRRKRLAEEAEAETTLTPPES